MSKPKGAMTRKMSYFFKELKQYDLSTALESYLSEMMLEGLEIMTYAEITQCIEDHLDCLPLE